MRGRNGAANVGDRALRYNMYGAAGEMAVAVYLGLKDKLYKDEYAVRGSSDLPGEIDVKTRTKHNYDLVVQLNDKPGKNYWLRRSKIKKSDYMAGCHILNARKKSTRRIQSVAGLLYFVPKHVLNPPETWVR